MTQAPLGLPPHLLPRPKALPASSSTSSLHALATSPTPQLSRASSRNRQESSFISAPPSAIDVSDKATSTLIRRVLCPQGRTNLTDTQPIDELLPPLTSSNDVDLQLYAIIAIVVKEFVYSWYGKITPDQGFVEEVVRIFAHCTRAVEQRIRRVDIESLALDEIPQLIEGHVNAFRASHQPFYPPSIAVVPRRVYHTLVPHPAFSPMPNVSEPTTAEEQSQNESAYRQLLVQGALAVLLPTEDLENACLRILVADVMGEMILGNGIGGKACQGWLIWEGITKLADSVKARVERKASGEGIETQSRSRLEKFGLLSEKEETHNQPRQGKRSTLMSEAVWRILQYGYLSFLALRFIILGLIAAYSGPSRLLTSTRLGGSSESNIGAQQTAILSSDRPILSFKIFPLISILLNLPARAPWLTGSVSLVQYHLIRRPLRLGAGGGMLDNFLHSLLATHVFAPALLPPLLLSLRTALFPNNTPAPPRADPSPAEQIAIKRRCARALLSLIPPRVAKRFFAVRPTARPPSTEATLSPRSVTSINTSARESDGEGPGDADEEQMLAEVEAVLDVFGDAYMNKHLVFGIVELCVVRLMPEMGEMGVRELMETRLGEGWEEEGG
ncbi:hypothetical protein MMC13_007025 [Lambiella insularis]|nr:hypothetical protein [Lambiella insularis]